MEIQFDKMLFYILPNIKNVFLQLFKKATCNNKQLRVIHLF